MRDVGNRKISDPDVLIGPVVAFLRRRTPAAWVEQAICDIDTLLLDHATLELKAALQAQKLINRYGASEARGLGYDLRKRLIDKLSRLAREELRHFEQVVELIDSRGGQYRAISPSRYAAGLHELVRKSEPSTLLDMLIIGAVIEARSCERFYSLVEHADRLDAPVGRFYLSLLRSEARHFKDYLALARIVSDEDIQARIDAFLSRDAELIDSEDDELRFLGGRVATDAAAATLSR
jgi:tRNA-(ms[2]io[6]A)-hydroxylase